MTIDDIFSCIAKRLTYVQEEQTDVETARFKEQSKINISSNADSKKNIMKVPLPKSGRRGASSTKSI